ncbi:hypothetical protein B0T14DRAFT_559035 [Immersiella caudata]|uniref:Uncharacterized protein n=1 Tax=Immersiella caudata TaxID=314043 RepID=A0AA39XC58_9PEZI|nr:hypothetical protein B0T14DRAFT_559035 [Immersiella caudata]
MAQVGTQPSVVVERRQLACLGAMIGDAVFVFGDATSEEFLQPRSYPEEERLYVSGTSEDFAQPDTTSESSAIFHSGTEWKNKSAPLKILRYGDTILIGSVTESQPAASDQNAAEKTAVAKCSVLSLPMHPLQATGRSRISQISRPPVFANPDCPLNPTESRRESEPFLSALGTSPEWWSLTEIQGMAAVNPGYIAIQGAFSMTKQSGIPPKRVLLDRWVGDENLSLFDEPRGLQVSLCTGVARRFPLRAVIEGPLIEYVDSLSIPGWDALKPDFILVLQTPHESVRLTVSAWAARLSTAEDSACELLSASYSIS